MSNQATFLLADDSEKYFIKIVGCARYTNCADFACFVNKIIEESTFVDILVDLSETEFLDSTNLGLLAKLAGAVFSKYERKMTLISTHDDISDLLVNTGFDQIMLIIENPDFYSQELEELPDIDDVDRNMARVMLEAHQALMDLNETNQQQFRTVVEMLSTEVDKQS